MAEPTATPARNDDVVDALRQLETTEAHLRARLRRRFGVSNSDIVALQHIDRAERGGRTVQIMELTAVLGITNSATTALVQRLEERGHLIKRPDPNNGRARLVTLTDNTRAQLLEALEATQQRVDDVIASISDTERARSIKLLHRIDEALRADNEAPLAVPPPAPL